MSDITLLNRQIPSLFGGSYLAQVVDVNDPEGLGRVQIKLLSFDGSNEQDAAVWARVACPFAGNNRGGFFIPDVDDEVLVTLVNGDPRQPVVIGGLWSGSADVPETIGNSVDKWTITGKAGTRIAIEEESQSNETISFTTPGGVSGELTDSGGGKIEFIVGGTTVTYDGQSVTIDTSLRLEINAPLVQVSASTVTVDAGISRFSGLVQADSIITNSIISASYTPGAGNIW